MCDITRTVTSLKYEDIGERIEPTSMHGFLMTPTYIMRKNLLINLAIYKTRSRICGTEIASKKSIYLE